MKRLHSHLLWCTVAILLIFGSIMAQVPQKPKQDPVLIFHLTLPQASSVIYALRNSTILDAQTANGLADLLVTQANDSTLQKAALSQTNKTPKNK